MVWCSLEGFRGAQIKRFDLICLLMVRCYFLEAFVEPKEKVRAVVTQLICLPMVRCFLDEGRWAFVEPKEKGPSCSHPADLSSDGAVLLLAWAFVEPKEKGPS